MIKPTETIFLEDQIEDDENGDAMEKSSKRMNKKNLPEMISTFIHLVNSFVSRISSVQFGYTSCGGRDKSFRTSSLHLCSTPEWFASPFYIFFKNKWIFIGGTFEIQASYSRKSFPKIDGGVLEGFSRKPIRMAKEKTEKSNYKPC